MKFVFSGSFDPVTNGHIEIIRRASLLCDELVVCVFKNNKKKYRYDSDKRKKMLELATKNIANVSVDVFSGLLADYCKSTGANAVVRGLRDFKDFEYEREMALVNYCKLGVDTVFLISDPKMSFISSSSVRELLEFGSDVKGLVPEIILDIL